MTTNATVTLLFTDLVEGTALLEQLGADAAQTLRHTHFQLLRDAITAHNGREVKTVGDGLMVVFQSAVDAVDCAVAMVQSVDRYGRRNEAQRFDIRLGINVGEPTRENEDYFGFPVVLAKRLCDVAGPGQILASDVVRALVGPRTAHRFHPLEPRDLKGVGITAMYEVGWEPSRAMGGAVPAALTLPADGVFVGRDSEMSKLAAAWKEVSAGARRAVLIGGEPGVGKTRLASELAAQVQGEGTVLYGRCDEDLGVPYQPFAEALRASAAACSDDELSARLGRSGASLARVIPELRDRLPDLPAAAPGEVEAERYLLFEAVAEFLGAASLDQPVLLVLDDLHWAAKPTLMLLRHVLRSTVAMNVLIVGTFRDTELDAAPLLAETLADLRRDSDVERMSLRGLDRDSVAEFVAAAGMAPDTTASLAEVVFAGTEGNPFFVGEILRHLNESGEEIDLSDVGLPPGVKDVVISRLSRLSPTANQILTLGSVVGARFELGVIERLAAIDADALLDGLDEAVRARVIVELPPVGHYTFAHALIRQVLLDELTASRRARLHWRVTEAMASMPDADERVEELAFHSAEAGAVGDLTQIATYALNATRHALDRLAYEPAVELANQGLNALARVDAADPRARAELLLALAEACNFTGAMSAMKGAAIEGAAAARAADWPEGLARAAVLYGRWVELGVRDPVTEDLCAEAFQRLSDDDAPWRARVLTTLANYHVNGYGRGVDVGLLAARSLTLARTAGDPESVAWALYLRAITLVATGDIDERMAIAEELVGLSQDRDDSRAKLDGHVMRATTRLELGDIAGFEADTDELERLSSRLQWWAPDFWAGNFRITRQTVAGHFVEAETMADEQYKRGAQDVNAFNAFAAQLFAVRREVGKLEDIEPLIVGGVEANRDLISFRAGLALTWTELGRPDDALGEINALAEGGFEIVPRDASFTACIALVSEAAATLGDTTHAAVLAELLAPHSGRLIVGGVGIVCFGAVDRYIGMLAMCNGDYPEAVRRLEAAAQLEERVGSEPFLARTRYWLARALIEGATETQRAGELLAQAGAVAQNLGMAGLARQVNALGPR